MSFTVITVFPDKWGDHVLEMAFSFSILLVLA